MGRKDREIDPLAVPSRPERIGPSGPHLLRSAHQLTEEPKPLTPAFTPSAVTARRQKPLCALLGGRGRGPGATASGKVRWAGPQTVRQPPSLCPLPPAGGGRGLKSGSLRAISRRKCNTTCPWQRSR